jgi:hypothetical protein
MGVAQAFASISLPLQPNAQSPRSLAKRILPAFEYLTHARSEAAFPKELLDRHGDQIVIFDNQRVHRLLPWKSGARLHSSTGRWWPSVTDQRFAGTKGAEVF